MNTVTFEYTNWKGARKLRTVKPERIVFGITPHISKSEWLLEGLDVEKGEKRLFVLKHIQRFADEKVQRFFCVTVYVKNKDDKFLMLHNKKLDKWVPAGGKVDNCETPDEAAVRECFEETGVRIKLVGNTPEIEGGLITPLGSQCNVIKKGVRDHVDLIYYGEPIDNTKLKMSEREAYDIGWFCIDEIENLNTFDSVKYWSKKILENSKN